jgi:hypothetical protein
MILGAPFTSLISGAPLRGGDGSDTYRFGLGGGADTIDETVTLVNHANAIPSSSPPASRRKLEIDSDVIAPASYRKFCKTM